MGDNEVNKMLEKLDYYKLL